VQAKAEALLAAISDPLLLGTSELVDGFIVETHTLGCRNHADEPQEQWWERHWAIHDEYVADGFNVIVGDPAEGRFATITPARASF
jgi:hypothetical protein